MKGKTVCSKTRAFGCVSTGTVFSLILYLFYISETSIMQYRLNVMTNWRFRTYTNHSDTFKIDLNRTRSDFENCKKRFPGAIVVGIQKCGTGALMVFLNLHPQIAAVLNPEFPDGNMAKELKFFTMKYRKGLVWYRDHMPCSYADQITVEKDPPYFYRAYSARRIRMMDPATKIIIIMKEPIERALSNHAMAASGKTHYPTFEEKVTNDNGQVKETCTYIKHSNYAKFIDPWIENFGLDRILFIDGHKYEINPVTELQTLETFLNIKPYFDENMFWYNETKGKHCFYSKDASALCLSEIKGTRHETITKNLRHKLQLYFKPLNEELFRKIKRRFNWGY